MSEKTKAVNLTENEIEEIIMHHGRNVADNFSARIERLSYLHKRLKAFNEAEITADTDATNPANQQVKGWGQ